MTDERPAANGAGETAQLSVGQGRKMPRPEAVIFDIGNVLIEWRPERFYDRLIGQARRRALFAEVDLHAMNDRIDRVGKLSRCRLCDGGRHPPMARRNPPVA